MIILIILKRLLLTLSSLLFLMSTTMMTISLAGSFNSCCWVFSRIFVTLYCYSSPQTWCPWCQQPWWSLWQDPYSCFWVFWRIFVTLLLLSTNDFLVVLDVNNHDRLTVSDILPSAWNFFFGKTYLEFYLIFVHILNPISSSYISWILSHLRTYLESYLIFPEQFTIWREGLFFVFTIPLISLNAVQGDHHN